MQPLPHPQFVNNNKKTMIKNNISLLHPSPPNNPPKNLDPASSACSDDFLDFFFTLNDCNNIIIYPKIYWNKQNNPELQGYYLENGDKVFNCPLYLCSYVMKKAEEYENKESLKLNRMLLVKRKNDKVDC